MERVAVADIACPYCDRSFATARNLHIHVTMAHLPRKIRVKDAEGGTTEVDFDLLEEHVVLCKEPGGARWLVKERVRDGERWVVGSTGRSFQGNNGTAYAAVRRVTGLRGIAAVAPIFEALRARSEMRPIWWED